MGSKQNYCIGGYNGRQFLFRLWQFDVQEEQQIPGNEHPENWDCRRLQPTRIEAEATV